ncbi:MAG: hypothetical protein Q8M92_02250 [Candidatus Subteraquimicrobiales bacterium]|nr:hypothetical protein [Candidatus Subteraquimicrobiales bacterium]
MDDKIKWLFTIANKNDIPKERIYEYMLEKHNKTSVRELTPEELKDVTLFASDARLITFEKQVYRLIKMGIDMGIDREQLNRMSKRFGALTMEELDEAGLRGFSAMLAGIEKKIDKELPVIKTDNITVIAPQGDTLLKVRDGDWKVRQHKDELEIHIASVTPKGLLMLADTITTKCMGDKGDVIKVLCGTNKIKEMVVTAPRGNMHTYVYVGEIVGIRIAGVR